MNDDECHPASRMYLGREAFLTSRCRANVVHIRQSNPDFGVVFLVTFKFSLRSEAESSSCSIAWTAIMRLLRVSDLFEECCP